MFGTSFNTETRAVTQCVTKGHQIVLVVHLEFSMMLSPSQPFFGMSHNAPPKETASHIRTTFLFLK